jgi:hypothetical protein
MRLKIEYKNVSARFLDVAAKCLVSNVEEDRHSQVLNAKTRLRKEAQIAEKIGRN